MILLLQIFFFHPSSTVLILHLRFVDLKFFWSKACSGCCWSMSVLVLIFLHHGSVYGWLLTRDINWIICMFDPQVQRVLNRIPDQKRLLLTSLNYSKRICFCILNEKDFIVLQLSNRIFYEYRISRPNWFPNLLTEIVFSKLYKACIWNIMLMYFKTAKFLLSE